MHGDKPPPDHNVPRVIETGVRIGGNMNIILMLSLSVAHVICGCNVGNNYCMHYSICHLWL